MSTQNTFCLSVAVFNEPSDTFQETLQFSQLQGFSQIPYPHTGLPADVRRKTTQIAYSQRCRLNSLEQLTVGQLIKNVRPYWKVALYYSAHKRKPFDFILSWTNPAHTPNLCFLMMTFHTILLIFQLVLLCVVSCQRMQISPQLRYDF